MNDYAVEITWNSYPDEPARYITGGNTYPPPVKRFAIEEAREFVASVTQRPDNAHLSFRIVEYPRA